jgi:hypothetical protein
MLSCRIGVVSILPYLSDANRYNRCIVVGEVSGSCPATTYELVFLSQSTI